MKRTENTWKVARRLLLLFLILGVIFLFANKTKEEEYYVIFIPKTQINRNDFWSCIRTGAETAAKENNLRLEIDSPSDEINIEEQNQLILKAIDKNPDVIVVSPCSNTENREALEKVKEAQIPLVFIDSTTDENIADSIVATDNVSAGRKMAEVMLNSLDDHDRIAIVSHVKTASTAMEREKGFRMGLGEHVSQIVEVVYSDSIKNVGYQVTKDLLLREPDIQYLACTNEDSAVGAARAVKELGLTGKIFIVGFDNSLEEIKQLEEGVFQAIVVQRAFSMGYFGMENAAKLAKKEQVSDYMDSGSVVITKENMYEEENQELLFPFY